MMSDSDYSFSRLLLYPYRMTWNINELCNFGCEYCFFPKVQKEHPDVGRLSHDEILESFNKTGKQWTIFIAGGEPMLYPDFTGLVNVLKTQHLVQISTNLYNKKIKEFARCVTPENMVTINASLHIPYHSKKSLQQFIRNYHLYREHGFDVAVSYVTYPPLFDRIKDDFRFLKEQGIECVFPLTFQGIYNGRRYPGSYTPEQVKIISDLCVDQLELLVTLDMRHFYNRLCRAGSNYFFMDVSGEVYRCATIRTSYGNLFKGTFNPGNEARPCTVHNCNDACQGIMSLVETPAAPRPEQSNKKNFMFELFNNFNRINTITRSFFQAV